MTDRTEIYHIFLAAFAQRAPGWVHLFNDCNIINVCLIIETYDTYYHGQALLRGGTYIRAIPRDCARMIFGSLKQTRWNANRLFRLFVGRRPRRRDCEGSGIVGRPDPSKYLARSVLTGHIMFYEGELLFMGKRDVLFGFMLNGYRHSSGIVLSGRSAEIFNELLAAVIAITGPLPIPTSINYNGNEYVLRYCCRGYMLATTYVQYNRCYTTYCSIMVREGIYSPYDVTYEHKRQVFAQPLP